VFQHPYELHTWPFSSRENPQLILNRGWVGPSNRPGCYRESNHESSDVQAYPEETGTGVVDFS